MLKTTGLLLLVILILLPTMRLENQEAHMVRGGGLPA
jgi:hypothetical protein